MAVGHLMGWGVHPCFGCTCLVCLRSWSSSGSAHAGLPPLHRGVLPHTCATSLGAAEANLLFGRGFRAGIDRREQKKTAAESEADMQKRMRDQLGA